MSEPTAEHIERYRRDGFLIVERFLERAELTRIREHFMSVFEHKWETGIAPDEVNYVPGVTAPDLTRQLCNVWKADRVLAGVTLARQVGEFAARLASLPGVRLAQDNAIWKPPSGKALLCHQDAAYLDHLDPPNMTTCWIALDDTAADTGTIYYVRGSHQWPHGPLGGTFHAPDDWLGHVRSLVRSGMELELVPIEVRAGGAAFHDGWTFHGSPPNERSDAQRRSIISHMISTDTRWNPEHPHPIYSRYRRPGETELDEAFFPILWQAGYRTSWLDDYAPSGADVQRVPAG
ncbi:MAG: phytanoyl-CoA dioxygenase family protein [Solirubrobacterales bacterium]|nr:phytanoyl-CoA dioxygenase family protein [Solirubrobacterales bacterium]MBV9365999.1 phytanoyl-CoA dioxygenase family protein [Solirubrobacterales bacterium]MBV9806013.1 phytanoyl-CoA dioxygenase family protein [Solirubrobacterales bacterium]